MLGVTATPSTNTTLRSMASSSTNHDTAFPILFTPLTPEAKHMIDKNHALHHVLFNHNKFHNHLPHHVVSNLAQGCDQDATCGFQKLWDVYEKYLDAKPPVVEDVVVGEGNWREWLGKIKYYSNYLAFFENLIDRDGILAVVQQYALCPDMASRLVSGAVHPLIHIGFGMESMDRAITSEGLAELCIHKETVKPILDQLAPLNSLQGKRLIVDVLKDLRADKKIDAAVSFKDENKTDTVIAHASMLKEYLNQWKVEAEREDIRGGIKELVEAATLILFASSRPGHPKSPVLDFFLMHVLTSTVSLRQMVPHLSLHDSAQLLRAHYAVLIMYYVARGRPPLARPYLIDYPVKQSWEQLAKSAFGHEDAHVSKVVRAMHLGEQDWDEENGLWRCGAQMCVDVIVEKGGDWSFSGMFDEIWE